MGGYTMNIITICGWNRRCFHNGYREMTFWLDYKILTTPLHTWNVVGLYLSVYHIVHGMHTHLYTKLKPFYSAEITYLWTTSWSMCKVCMFITKHYNQSRPLSDVTNSWCYIMVWNISYSEAFIPSIIIIARRWLSLLNRAETIEYSLR